MKKRLLLFLCLLGAAVWMLHSGWELASADRNSSKVQIERRNFGEYYQRNISPLIDAADARDREAADVALTRLHEHFAMFHRGVPNFTRDITSWGTRFGVVGRGFGDWWAARWGTPDRGSVRKFTEQKFRDWVVSEATLKRAMDDMLATFEEALVASHNRLEGEIKLAIGRPDSPVRKAAVRIDTQLAKLSSTGRILAEHAGFDSAKIGGLGFAGGTAATMAAEQLVRVVVAQMAARTAAVAAASGTATAGGAAAGGGGGSAAGPLGTIVGIGIGFAVGAVVDWWMNEQFEQRLHAQLTRFLNELERDLISGVNGNPGLQHILSQTAGANNQQYRKALFEELERAVLP